MSETKENQLAGYKGQRIKRTKPKKGNMRIRNKKTGEILDLGSFIIQNPNRINCEVITKYDSLAELNEEWEDASEEPNEYWYIDSYGTAIQAVYHNSEWHELRKQIGNYFKTKEEAEKAVEKLKAWKRLKDKRFSFLWWVSTISGDQIEYRIPDYDHETKQDMDLLFGGEE